MYIYTYMYIYIRIRIILSYLISPFIILYYIILNYFMLYYIVIYVLYYPPHDPKVNKKSVRHLLHMLWRLHLNRVIRKVCLSCLVGIVSWFFDMILEKKMYINDFDDFLLKGKSKRKGHISSSPCASWDWRTQLPGSHWRGTQWPLHTQQSWVAPVFPKNTPPYWPHIVLCFSPLLVRFVVSSKNQNQKPKFKCHPLLRQ